MAAVIFFCRVSRGVGHWRHGADLGRTEKKFSLLEAAVGFPFGCNAFVLRREMAVLFHHTFLFLYFIIFASSLMAAFSLWMCHPLQFSYRVWGEKKGGFHCYMIRKVNQRVFKNQLLPVGCSITISASIWRCGIAWHRGGICSASPLAAATLSHLM